MTQTKDFGAKVRNAYPIFAKNKNLIYLDSASSAQKPQVVIDAMTDFLSSGYANVHRGLYDLSSRATQKYENTRKIVAHFIEASPKEIIFTSGTTNSLNFLSYTIQSIIKKRKKIVLTQMEHHANIVPWQEFAKRNNMTIEYIKLTPNYDLDYADAKNKITNDVAIVACAHVSNTLGAINDVTYLCELAKKAGAISIIDGAQAIGHIEVNVKNIDCDFYAFSGHKMGGPTGIGVLYGKFSLLEKLEPFQFGGHMIETVDSNQSTWNSIPARFEAGTPAFAEAIGLGTAIEHLEKTGISNIAQWESALSEYCLKKLLKIKGIKIYKPKNATGIISFTIKGIHPHDMASLLNDDNICIRGGHHCSMPLMKVLQVSSTARISFHAYNTFEDVDTLIESLQKITRLFSNG